MAAAAPHTTSRVRMRSAVFEAQKDVEDESGWVGSEGRSAGDTCVSVPVDTGYLLDLEWRLSQLLTFKNTTPPKGFPGAGIARAWGRVLAAALRDAGPA